MALKIVKIKNSPKTVKKVLATEEEQLQYAINRFAQYLGVSADDIKANLKKEEIKYKNQKIPVYSIIKEDEQGNKRESIYTLNTKWGNTSATLKRLFDVPIENKGGK